MNLTDCQELALHRMIAFVNGRDETSFSLQGGAGVGKTFLVSEFVSRLLRDGVRVMVAAPTHKACRVLRGKLDAAGIPWAFKPQRDVPPGVAIVDTTAALLGIRPMVDDDQDEDELKFKPAGNGSLGKLFDTEGSLSRGAPVLVIDEVSMLGRDDLQSLVEALRANGAKLVAVGDEGQLPPVKKQAIRFEEDFDAHALLDEVVRQAKGSTIVNLAWAVRNAGENDDVQAIVEDATLLGGDIEAVDHVIDAYIEHLEAPVDDERERAVFIAYRNAIVNGVQDVACQRLYGHGRKAFRPGELVLATTPGFFENPFYVDKFGQRRLSRWPKMEQLCAVADQLRVAGIDQGRPDPVYGARVTLDRVDLPKGAANRQFDSFYLSEDELANEAHPFNARKRELLVAAKELQQKVREGKRHLDEERKNAWGAYFKHQQKVIGFAHPFAITSHKSQGSTYREAYVNVADLARFGKRALYVAVTRPSKKLVV